MQAQCDNKRIHTQMKIESGGKTESLKGVVTDIAIHFDGNEGRRTFELWINGDSLSYLSVNEVLDLRDEINIELAKLLKS